MHRNYQKKIGGKTKQLDMIFEVLNILVCNKYSEKIRKLLIIFISGTFQRDFNSTLTESYPNCPHFSHCTPSSNQRDNEGPRWGLSQNRIMWTALENLCSVQSFQRNLVKASLAFLGKVDKASKLLSLN